MFTANQLFKTRLKLEWQFNFRTLRAAANWTVWLYLLIPAIGFGIYNYILLWHGVYHLHSMIIYYFVYLIVYLFTWSGDIRSFLDFGDQLFIRQSNHWINHLLKMGLIYSLIQFLLNNFIVLGIFAPILMTYQEVSYIQLVYLFLFVYFFRLTHMLIKELITLHFRGWKRFIYFFIISGISLSFYAFFIYQILQNNLIYVSLIVIADLLIFFRLYSKKRDITWSFNEDCIRENNQRIKYARLLLQVSSHVDGPSIEKVKDKKRPWIFKKSNLLFKKRNARNGIIELYIKTTLRNKKNILGLLQLTVFFIFNILALPWVLKWGVFLFALYIMVIYLRGIKSSIESNYLFKMLQIDSYTRLKAARISIYLLALPSILVISLFTGLLLYTITSFGVFFMVIGLIIEYIMILIFIR